ncbi:MAG: nicotinate (nicotinamide) nucleotide adenylyltransferase [candidate division Zixibacteria bacterium]|nr:nicotinate (nicotinamide) nucleotide adenylyltransferase [candidate division Zixibacteria bacterium]
MPQVNPDNGGNWGIMGGAFDPIHNGHLILADSAFEALGLDGVLFIPSYNPPHRSSKPIASFEDRVKMTELAIEDKNKYCLSRIEESITGPCYTLSIIENLKSKYPKANWFIILGADNIVLFDSWYKPGEIVKYAKVVVGGRPGFNSNYKKSIWYNKVRHFDMPQTDISSTTIRQLLKDKKPIESLLPNSISKYIQDKGLYQ